MTEVQFASYRNPPPWVGRFRSDDLDEVRSFVADRHGEHSRVVHRPGPLGFELATLAGRWVRVGWARSALDTTIRGALPIPVLHLAPPAGGTYRFGRREYVARPHTAMFVARGWEFTRLSKPGAMLALAPDEDALLQEIASRLQIERGKLRLTTRPFTIDPVAHARLAAALDDLVRAQASGADPRQAEPAEAGLVAAVADILLEQSAAVPVRTGATARMGEVEEWIEANLAGPITAGRLCQVAGVGQRALEKVFESRHGMSPMRFVTERRLAAAHRMLIRGAAQDEDVTRVALGLGFGHPGRFATLYRQAYGESPSQSLRRARRRTGAKPST